MIRAVFGSNKSGTALIPIFDTINMALNISTRVGNSIISKGDGSADINYTNIKYKDLTDGIPGSPFTFNYTTAFSGNIAVKFLKGLSDIYSIQIGNILKGDNNTEKYNITDLETFFKQFKNLYSVFIAENTTLNARKSILKGDLSRFPDSVERVLIMFSAVINSASDLLLNFSNYSNLSKLKFFNSSLSNNDPFKILGDLGKLPSSCEFLYIGKAAKGSKITYSSSKVWASSFDTLYLPIPLTINETDNLLIDANNSIVSSKGGKSFTLQGGRTSFSDVAVAGLISKGFTVNCKVATFSADAPRLHIDSYYYSGSGAILDQSTYGNNGSFVGAGISYNATDKTFDFTGTGGYIDIPTSSSYFSTSEYTFSFWVNLADYATFRGFAGKTNGGNPNPFDFYTGSSSGVFNVFFGNGATTANLSSSVIETNTWVNVIVVFKNNNSIKVFVNGNLVTTKTIGSISISNSATSLRIGSRADGVTKFKGKYKSMKIYLSAFSDTEVLGEYCTMREVYDY